MAWRSKVLISDYSLWCLDLRHLRASPGAPEQVHSSPPSTQAKVATRLPPWSRARTGPRWGACARCPRRRPSTPRLATALRPRPPKTPPSASFQSPSTRIGYCINAHIIKTIQPLEFNDNIFKPSDKIKASRIIVTVSHRIGNENRLASLSWPSREIYGLVDSISDYHHVTTCNAIGSLNYEWHVGVRQETS